MLRFDSEASLEMHELGRSLLLMIRDDDIGFQFPQARQQSEPTVDPFAAIRGRFAAVDLAFQSLHAQVVGFLVSQLRGCGVYRPPRQFAMFRVFCPPQTLQLKVLVIHTSTHTCPDTPITAPSSC
jgi:hypothetical protein